MSQDEIGNNSAKEAPTLRGAGCTRNPAWVAGRHTRPLCLSAQPGSLPPIYEGSLRRRAPGGDGNMLRQPEYIIPASDSQELPVQLSQECLCWMYLLELQITRCFSPDSDSVCLELGQEISVFKQGPQVFSYDQAKCFSFSTSHIKILLI